MINIESDSRKVKDGDVFIAIKGLTVDGHDYIKEAINNGASKIIAEHGAYKIPTLIVPDTKEYLTNHLVQNYRYIFDDLKFIGITGTNGKTTTGFIVHQMLRALRVESAYIGTLGFYVDGELVRLLPNTTPDVLVTYKLIEEAREQGIKIIVMEVSSQALKENRVAGINFDVAAFTNLTQDHLDYHPDFADYLASKRKILEHLKSKAKMIVNEDDEYHKKFMNKYSLTLGKNNTDYRIDEYQLKSGKTDISFIYKDITYHLQTNFTGIFNVYNYLMAIAIVKELGYDLETIIKLSKEIYPPKGRCQTFNANNAWVIVDYAHTPDAVSKITECFKQVKEGRLITILGCGGNRDPHKRPIMGHIASQNSDYCLFTNDNPRCEDELQIMKDILSGVTSNNYEVIYNRREAIEKGIAMLKTKDILLILGKGHEDYQIIGHDKIHFDDTQVVEDILK